MTAAQTHVARGRRSPRPSGDDRERAILQTAERLLADRLLADISVDDLARGAGISRPTFYFYFASKEAVLLTLLDGVAAEADAALVRLAERPPTDLYALWRTGIEVFVNTFRNHPAVSRAAAVAKFANPDVRQLWSSFMQRWIAHTTAVIEAERVRGNAPAAVPAAQLSTALNLLNEVVLAAALAGEGPSVPGDDVLDTLTHIWVSSIYGPPR